MKWLIWKEYRLNRAILIVGAFLLVLPHGGALWAAWNGEGRNLLAPGTPHLFSNLLMSSMYSLVFSQLTLALLGGHAIACERVDRSAEFLGYLPLKRSRILAGKITLALLATALIWGLNLLVVLLVVTILPELPEPVKREAFEFCWVVGYIAITGAVFFCVGWLLSSLLESPTFSICAGLVTPLIIVSVLQTLAWVFEWSLDEPARWYGWTCLVLAPACFVAGTWYYLRRVEP